MERLTRRARDMKTEKYYERPTPNWVASTHISMTTYHSALYRDEDLKAQMEIITPKTKTGEFRDGKSFYFLDGDKREFKTEEEMLDAIMEGPKELWVHAGTTRK